MQFFECGTNRCKSTPGSLRNVEGMLLLILQVALIVFIAGSVLAVATVYVVRRRKVSYRHKIDPTIGPLGQMGVVAPTPLPEWASWDEDPDERPASR